MLLKKKKIIKKKFRKKKKKKKKIQLGVLGPQVISDHFQNKSTLGALGLLSNLFLKTLSFVPSKTQFFLFKTLFFKTVLEDPFDKTSSKS